MLEHAIDHMRQFAHHTAPIITFLGLPLAASRAANALKAGQQRIAVMAGKYKVRAFTTHVGLL